MKTRREWFKELPLQKRLQATENVRRERGRRGSKDFNFVMNTIKQTFHNCLYASFTFNRTKQGLDYWYRIARDHTSENPENTTVQ